MNKTKFFIILDIDGVLFDWKYLKQEMDSNNLKKGGLINNFSPKSMSALNYLIESLEKYYDVTLVISSSWRHSMRKTENALKQNGLVYNKTLENTPLTSTPENRGEEILCYLSTKNRPYDYVIIDDEMFDYHKHFDKNKIIKTHIYKGSLDINMVNKFLKQLFSQNNNESIYELS